jgi:alpha-amylase
MAGVIGGIVASARADVMLQGFWWNVPKIGDAGVTLNWWDRLATDAHKLGAAGFTSIWIPNPQKCSSGASSMGYDPFDDYDLGSKNQKGTIATRFGTRDQLGRMVAMMRANGIGVVVDVVPNHRQGYNSGSDPFHFWYADAYGNATGGRFEKFPCDFHNFGGNTNGVPQDSNVPDPGFDSGAPFGPDLAPVAGCNRNAWNKLNEAGDWLTKALGCQGYRLDYEGHQHAVAQGFPGVWRHERQVRCRRVLGR